MRRAAVDCWRLAYRSTSSFPDVQAAKRSVSLLPQLTHLSEVAQCAIPTPWASPATSNFPRQWLRHGSSTSCPKRAADPPPSSDSDYCAGQNCWKCRSTLHECPSFFCGACRVIQPFEKHTDFFALMGLDEPTFDINVSDLEARYKALQVKLHPDRFAVMSPQEQEYSGDQASAVNQAYHVLRQPLRRANYLLSLRGMGACEGLTLTDPELLEPVMEAREEVDATDDSQELESLKKKVDTQLEQCVRDLSAAFAAGDLERAAETTTVLRYMAKIQEAIIEKM